MENLILAIANLSKQVAGLFQGFTWQRKIALLVLGALVFGGISAFRWVMLEWAFRPLYADLSQEEAGAAVARLKELQVPYKLAAGGQTILVPEPKLAEVRLQLASDGLPRQGRLGFELFDESSFGATEFAEHVNFRRALEGELERSVLSLAEVERARVHISLPQKSVFLNREQPAKASVVLQLRRGAGLGREKVEAIGFLVSSAVEGLDPQRVVIVDTAGTVLARPRPEGEGFTDEQLEYQRKIERRIQNNIVATLEPYVGFDKVRVAVAAECDWNGGEETKEVLDPNTIVITTQKSEDTTQPIQESGVPGTASNLPRQPAQPRSGAVASSRKVETTNFQTSRTVTRTDLERGEIQRLSVAVLVDHIVELDEEAGKLIRKPRTPEEMDIFRQLVVAAAGIREERGDVLTIQALPFTIFEEPPVPPPPPAPPEEELFSPEWIKKFRYYLIAGAAVILVVMISGWLLVRLKRKVATIKAEAEARRAAAEAQREIEAAEQEARQKEVEEARMLKGLRQATLQSSKAQVLKKHLEETAAKDPEAFVQLMRSWIHENDK